MKILIIEDEAALLSVIRDALGREGYITEIAADFDQALDKISTYEYDCILLDIMLPGGSGLELLSEIKKNKKKEAVIIISAKDSVEDKVNGLDLGADDYLAKPFHLAELNARVKSAIRRKNQNGDHKVQWRNITLDPDNRTVVVNNADLLLNRKEFDLLYYFVTNPNRLINKTSIAEYVWGDYTDQASSLDFVYSQIKNLRKKLSTAGADADILSVYGVGYKIS
ncbi:response regulator transcription factor [Niabella drilacis]|uniref:DNA-binding response regulator, OmpR family, contains REC and winged-helix (WHTH) domain n=1 Tax=Niabella drilacis (strain DSM 25811 / CCM 8410 / CCUG 62505 / LMG 26954 / E90) TaxID=1285928 RepID=A0A1G6IJU2_NIADE|nr:response regulator transcription factor [Niabella drilacis]SDC06777.1 DNA-binding response regulator, OmpR family, contains REC and winged-helix (wHTH) domain [Niabella drilacis]